MNPSEPTTEEDQPACPEDLAERPRAVLKEAVARFRPVKLFALFSGGHDSLCAAHVASGLAEFDGCVHIDTGIGVPQTREFVRRTCERMGWPLLEYRPPVGYDELVLRWGFPGPAGHTLMYNRLKERCLRQLLREHKKSRGDLVALVTGVRRQESRRRMGYVVPIQKEGAHVWVAPLADWSREDKEAYLDAHDLERNDVVAKLCMSGECLCGAFARKDEIHEIEFWFPEVAARIHELEAKARAAGVHAVWGERPARENSGKPRRDNRPGLCWSCEARRQAVEGE